MCKSPSYVSVFLTEDVLEEILSRLPIKSLLRLKCVCKEWKAIIENPVFVTKNFNRNLNCTCLLVQYVPQGQKFYNFVLFPDLKLDNTPLVYEDVYIELPENSADVFGPVNGLFLVHSPAFKGIHECLALWNPATREWNPLPIPEPPLPKSYSPLCHTFGFGLDPSSNDYKIIWFRFFIDEETENPYIELLVAVYTLYSGAWRYIDFPFNCSFMDDHDTYVRGICYWGMQKEGTGFSILSFDMENELFIEILAPKGLERQQSPFLALYGDLLAIFAFDYDRSCYQCSIDIWVMREGEYWIKHLSLGPFPEFYSHHGFWKSNEILFELQKSGRMILYNTDNGESRDLGIQGRPEDALFYTFCYKESLFSTKTMYNHGL